MKRSSGAWMCVAALALFGAAMIPKVAAQSAPAAKPKAQGWAQTRVEEKLDRGMLAVRTPKKTAYVGWRLLRDDAPGTAFNVYRASGGGEAVKLNARPLSKTTDFIDRKPPQGGAVTYWVRPVNGGREGAASEKAALGAETASPACVRIKLQGNVTVQKVGIADLDGDGQYDFVIKQPQENIDPYANYWTRSPDTYKLEAYRGDGTFLWRKDLGWSIERGIWYSPYLVYDFDGDGKAEVAVKTGEGDPREPDGRVTKGAEWLSLLDGMTGKEITRIPWIARDPRIGEYNHLSRNQLGVAYLDGKTPCLLMERGTYQMMVLEAYQFRNGKLEKLWHWDSDENGKTYYGQGAHFIQAADIDVDGRDEVLMGSNAIDDNGQGLWSTGLGHPDKAFIGDIDPARPGLEIAYFVERGQKQNGIALAEAKSGKILWGLKQKTIHIHEGTCADIDPSLPGLESWGAEAGKADPQKENYHNNPPRWFFSAQGKLLGTYDEVPPMATTMAWWDADLLREFPFKGRIYKYGRGTIEKGLEGRVIETADLYGDWREEIITSVPGELRIYTTTIPAADRRTCLMQDPLYHNNIACLAMAYPQPPMVSTFLGYATPRPFKKKDAGELARMNAQYWGRK